MTKFIEFIACMWRACHVDVGIAVQSALLRSTISRLEAVMQEYESIMGEYREATSLSSSGAGDTVVG
jgi:hypothetical protein